MQGLIAAEEAKVSRCCESFICNGTLKHRTSSNAPITLSGISPLVSFVSRDAQLYQVGHLCFGLLPLLPDVHSEPAPHPFIPGHQRSFPWYSAFNTLTSFRSVLETYDCSALPLKKIKVLWPRLTSCSSLLLRLSAPPYFPSARSPRVRATTFLPCNRHIYRTEFGQHWTSCC